VFGHKHEHERQWAPAAGIVAESRKHHREWSYVVDYRRPTGETFRVTVPALDGHNVELAPGTQVQIEVDAASGEARLAAPPVSAGPPSVREAIHLAREMRGPDGAAAVAAMLSGLGQPGPGVRVVTSSEVHIGNGPEVRVVGGAQAAEVMEAVQELMSGHGDPATARERMRHLKEELMTQNGMPGPAEPTAFSSPEPSTFDSVNEAPSAPIAPTTFSSPDPSVGQPGPSFGQSGYSPAAPATSFSSPANPGSFNAGSSFNSGIPAGAGGSFASGSFGDFGATKSDRIARLEDQRDRGQITPEQFAAQRQQIEDEL
jgi:hypothetical protein